MQDDIVVRKPPASAGAEANSQADEAQAQSETAKADKAPNPAVKAALTKSSAPVGIIAAAIFVCLSLIFAAVYSTLAQA